MSITGKEAKDSPWRIFTSSGGARIEARVVNISEDVVKGNTVILQRKSDQKTFELPVSKLSPEDQEYLEDFDLDKTMTRQRGRPQWEDDIGEEERFKPKKEQRSHDFFPEVVNAKGTSIQPFPMGPLHGVMTVKMGSRTAAITQLDSRGPASRAGLKPGDLIIGANGKRFDALNGDPATGGDGVPRDLGLAILESQDEGVPLVLEIVSGIDEKEVSIELPKLPDFSKDFPASCARSDYLRDAAAEWLATQYSRNGNFGSGNQYATSMAALALLSTGDRGYRSILRDVAKSFAYTIENRVSNSNWIACAMAVYLAEYHLATGERAVLDAIEKTCIEMGGRVAPDSGRLGHNGKALPYGGKGLVITTAHLHWLWGLAHRCGILIDEDAWDLSYKSVEVSLSDNGSVGYNFSARGSNQSAARTGCMATALELAEQSRADQRRMVGWLGDNYKRCTNGHATASLGMILGFMGSSHGSERQHRECLDYHRWLWALCTPKDDGHGVFYYCIRGNFGGDGYLGYRTVGNYVTLLTLNSARKDCLWSFGNREKEWLKK